MSGKRLCRALGRILAPFLELNSSMVMDPIEKIDTVVWREEMYGLLGRVVPEYVFCRVKTLDSTSRRPVLVKTSRENSGSTRLQNLCPATGISWPCVKTHLRWLILSQAS
jgi:hypothetical protein